MSSKISALTELNAIAIGQYDYVTVANTLLNTNYKVKLVDVILPLNLVDYGFNSPKYLISDVSSTGGILQKGLESLSNILTIAEASSGPYKNIQLDLDLSALDLAECDNTTSGFLTETNLENVTGTLSVANGGTSKTSFTAKSVLTTQDESDSAIVEKVMNIDGSLLIGSVGGGPEVGTLTAGDNVSISNGANSITISSSFTTATDTVDMNGYNIDMSTGWISNDGADGGVSFDSNNRVYIGNSENEFYEDSLNINGGISLKSDSSRFLGVSPGINPQLFTIYAQDSGGTNVSGGDLIVRAGAGSGSGDGGNLFLQAGLKGATGDPGGIVFRVSGDNSVVINSDQSVDVNAGDININGVGKGLKVPYEAITQNTSLNTAVSITEISGQIVLFPESIQGNGAQKMFQVFGSMITGTSKIFVSVIAPNGEAEVGSFIVPQVTDRVSGSFKVRLMNLGANNSSTNSHILHFLIVK